MKPTRTMLAALALAIAFPAWSADPPVCKSGPESGWKSKELLTKRLVAEGLRVEQILVVGDCYAVYAVNNVRQPVNNYYHPVSLKLVGPIKN